MSGSVNRSISDPPGSAWTRSKFRNVTGSLSVDNSCPLLGSVMTLVASPTNVSMSPGAVVGSPASIVIAVVMLGVTVTESAPAAVRTSKVERLSW